MVLSKQTLGHMGANNAHKADDAEEGHTHGCDDRGQQHGHEAQPIHRHTHALGCRVTTQERVELPAHESKKRYAYKYYHSHYQVCSVSRAAQVAKSPDHGGGKPHVGSVKLQDRCGCRPNGTDRDTGQYHHAGLEGPDAAEAQDQQDRNRSKDKGHQRSGIRICAHSITGQVIPGVQKTACKGNDRKICSEDRCIRNTQCGRRGHGVIQIGLHDKTGHRQSCARNDGCQHARDADVPDNSYLGSAAFFQESIHTVAKTHMRRADKQAHESKRQYCNYKQYKRHHVPFSAFQ